MVDENFHGRGASFPLQVSSTGSIQESEGVRKIEESIRIILGTQHGERVMRPDFGCNLRELLFAPIDQAARLASHLVTEGLSRWEQRIKVVEVSVDMDNRLGRLIINILYEVKATRDVRSLVYPFYLEPRQS